MPPSPLTPSERVCTACGGSVLGLFIGFLCPLCVPASAAALSSIGLVWLPQKHVIFPLIALFSLTLLYGLLRGVQKHGNVSPLLFGAVGMWALPLGRYVLGSAMLAYTGALCILVATVWNLAIPPLDDHVPLDRKELDRLLNSASA